MARLWIANLPPEAGDDEIDEFLQKYGFPTFGSITRVPGDGSRPAAIIDYPDLKEEVLGRLTPRVSDMTWRERTLFANVMPPERS
ncbi:MAG: RNA-binding protein [Burkholderiaceae bacterium]|nr:RNA-binding protein [Burkholderiaceae bacterium]